MINNEISWFFLLNSFKFIKIIELSGFSLLNSWKFMKKIELSWFYIVCLN